MKKILFLLGLLIVLNSTVFSAAITITKTSEFPLGVVGSKNSISATFAIENTTTVPLKILPQYFSSLPQESQVTLSENCDQANGFAPGQTCNATITVGPNMTEAQNIQQVGPVITFPTGISYQPANAQNKITLMVYSKWTASSLTGGSINSLLNIDGTLYAATNLGGVYQLNSKTGAWSGININLAGMNTTTMAEFEDKLYVAGGSSSPFLQTYDATTAEWEDVADAPNAVAVKMTSTESALYVAFNNNQVFSYNGSAWTQQGGTVPQTVTDITTIGGVLYASTENGIYKLDAGIWEALNTGLPATPNVHALYTDGTTLYAGVNAVGIYKLNGATWEAENTGISDRTVTQIIDVQEKLYAGTTENGIYELNDGTWAQIEEGLPTQRGVRAFVEDATHNLYTGLDYDGVYTYNSSSESWAPANTSLNAFSVTNFTANANGPYIAAGNSVYQQTSSRWTRVEDPLAFTTTSVAANSSGEVYVGTWQGSVWKTDGETAWAQISTGMPTNENINQLLFDSDGNIWAATYSNGMMRLPEGGTTWQATTGLAGTVGTVYMDAENNLYAGAASGAYKWSGTTWAAINTGFAASTTVYKFMEDNDGALLAATSTGLYKYSDNTWTSLTANSPTLGARQDITSVVVSQKLLFIIVGGARTEGQGVVYVSDDDGATWSDFTGDLIESQQVPSNLFVNSSAIYAFGSAGVVQRYD